MVRGAFLFPAVLASVAHGMKYFKAAHRRNIIAYLKSPSE